MRRVQSSRRLKTAAGVAFCVLAVAVGFLAARRLTSTSWPLQEANVVLVLAASAAYLASFFLRALGWQRLFPGERPGPEPLPRRVRRRGGERRRAAVPARLRRQDLDAAAARRRPARPRDGRPVDRLARARRRRRDAAARGCRDRDERRDLPRAADRRAALLPRLHRRARARAEARAAAVRPPVSAARADLQTRRRPCEHLPLDLCRERLPVRLLDDARSRQRLAAERARRRVLADPRARRPLHGGGGVDPADHRRRRNRQRRRHVRRAARARRHTGRSDQLLAGVRACSSPAARSRPPSSASADRCSSPCGGAISPMPRSRSTCSAPRRTRPSILGATLDLPGSVARWRGAPSRRAQRRRARRRPRHDRASGRRAAVAGAGLHERRDAGRPRPPDGASAQPRARTHGPSRLHPRPAGRRRR